MVASGPSLATRAAYVRRRWPGSTSVPRSACPSLPSRHAPHASSVSGTDDVLVARLVRAQQYVIRSASLPAPLPAQPGVIASQYAPPPLSLRPRLTPPGPSQVRLPSSNPSRTSPSPALLRLGGPAKHSNYWSWVDVYGFPGDEASHNRVFVMGTPLCVNEQLPLQLGLSQW